ncbi:MAG: DUF58 domain-containing protein [bacterium]|nr:DUF58 domain-containing protein [bacterium]
MRDRLSSVLHRFEFFRATPTGHMVTPETDSYRPYAPGDDPRYIDWSIYARQDRYFIKTVVREDEGIIHLFVDSSGSMRSPHVSKYHRCLETAAGIGYLALLTGNQVILHSWSDRILLTRSYEEGESSTLDFLQQLETLPSGSETDLGQSLEQLRNLGEKSPSRLLVISDFIEKRSYWEQLNLLKAAGSRLAAIRIMHEREVAPRLRGHYQISDPESGRQVRRLIGYRLQKEYRKTINTFMRETEESFHQQRVPFLNSTTRSPFEELVLNFFHLPSWNGWR